MKYIITIEIIIFIIAMVNARHCSAGYLGYPDEWDCKKHEKIHNILITLCIVICFIITPLTILFN